MLESTKLLIVQKIRVYRHAFAFTVHRLLFDFFATGRSECWATPPAAMVTVPKSLDAPRRCGSRVECVSARCAISRDALRPTSTSAARYSSTAAGDRGYAPRAAYCSFWCPVMRPTGNCKPAWRIIMAFARLSFSSSRYSRAFERALASMCDGKTSSTARDGARTPREADRILYPYGI